MLKTALNRTGKHLRPSFLFENVRATAYPAQTPQLARFSAKQPISNMADSIKYITADEAVKVTSFALRATQARI